MEVVSRKKQPMMSSKLFDLLMDAPDAPQIMEQMQSALQKEKQTRAVFYEWLNDDVKAEFINGEVVVHSPVKRGHLLVTQNLFRVLSTYVLKMGLGEVSVEKALIALSRNDYEPDLCFWTKAQAAQFSKDTMFHPAPALVVEILSKGTSSRDRGVKYEDYAKHGITEYWIIEPNQEWIEQYYLKPHQTEYTLQHKYLIHEHIESLIVTGFKIPVLALFDESENLQVLKGILGV
jgi:Uma2 family endonuclease